MALNAVKPMKTPPTDVCEERPEPPESRAGKIRDEFITPLVHKTKEDLIRWYPPLVAHRNPAIRNLLVAFFPLLGRVYAVGDQLTEGFKNLFRSRNAPR